MRRRLLIVLVCGSLMAALAGSSAAAAKPIPTADVAQVWSGCDVTVTITWSNFTGRFSANVGAADGFSGTDQVQSDLRTGARSGSYSHTFQYYATTTGPYNWRGYGFLARSDGTIITAANDPAEFPAIWTTRQSQACARTL